MARRVRKVRGWRRGQPAKCQLRGSERALLTPAQLKEARDAWVAGESQAEIARKIGVSIDTFRARLRDQLARLPARSRGGGSGRRGSDPTPEEIYGRLTLLEQASWSDEEREDRWVGPR